MICIYPTTLILPIAYHMDAKVHFLHINSMPNRSINLCLNIKMIVSLSWYLKMRQKQEPTLTSILKVFQTVVKHLFSVVLTSDVQ